MQLQLVFGFGSGRLLRTFVLTWPVFSCFASKTIHVATVACSSNREYADSLRLLKSITMQVSGSSEYLYSFHVFSDDTEYFQDTFLSVQERFALNLSDAGIRIHYHHVHANSKTATHLNLFRRCATTRLAFPELLPDVDALIHLDSDVLVFEPLPNLWRLFSTFDAHQLFAAVPEAFDGGWYACCSQFPDYVHPHGINSGVALMNLTRMRQTAFSQHIFKMMDVRKNELRLGDDDEDALNIFFNATPHELYILPCRWNLRTDTMTRCERFWNQGGVLHGNRSSFHFQREFAQYANFVGMVHPKLSADTRDIAKATCKVDPIPTFKTRSELGYISETLKFKRGVELGVQRGIYSKIVLDAWSSCEKYVLVDLWEHQHNYDDVANKDNAEQESIMKTALLNVAPFKDKVEVCRNFTTVCALNYPDNYFDFIYVDARHDFKGVLQDLHAWWPKLSPGGIMAGHDYVVQDDGPSQSGQNWTVNFDGTVDTTGTVVKGAVDEFASHMNGQVSVSYRETGWNTWAIRRGEYV